MFILGYIEPGTGSLIFQVVVGSALALPVAIAAFWRRITSFFARKDR